MTAATALIHGGGMQRVLTLEQSPPLAVPLRFFLTAPLFALLAAILLLWEGPGMLISRWAPATLAFTHLLTLGFLSMVMVGALTQILHVVVGVALPWQRTGATVIHLMLVAGTLLLAAGFLTSSAIAFRLALACLVAGFGWLLAACTAGLWRAQARTATATAIRLALAGLAVTVTLGATAASAFAWQVSLPLVTLTNVHAAWGLLAWVGLLTFGVAYQVVPMFQVTPLYPSRLARWLAPFVAIALTAWSLAALAPAAPGWLRGITATAIALAFLVFSVATLRLLRQRKRPPDAAVRFWRLAMTSLGGAILLGTAGRWLPPLQQAQWLPLTVGMLFIVGFAFTVINGMLYKIVPFLVWHHLHDDMGAQGMKAPNVRQVISDKAASRQFNAHLAALLLLAAAPLWPQWLARPAGLALGLSAAWLGWNMLQAMRVWRQARLQLSARAAGPA